MNKARRYVVVNTDSHHLSSSSERWKVIDSIGLVDEVMLNLVVDDVCRVTQGMPKVVRGVGVEDVWTSTNVSRRVDEILSKLGKVDSHDIYFSSHNRWLFWERTFCSLVRRSLEWGRRPKVRVYCIFLFCVGSNLRFRTMWSYFFFLLAMTVWYSWCNANCWNDDECRPTRLRNDGSWHSQHNRGSQYRLTSVYWNAS